MYAKDSDLAKLKIEELGKSHAKTAMNISPDMYDIWKSTLIETIEKHDKQITPDLLKNWNTVLSKGITEISSKY